MMTFSTSSRKRYFSLLRRKRRKGKRNPYNVEGYSNDNNRIQTNDDMILFSPLPPPLIDDEKDEKLTTETMTSPTTSLSEIDDVEVLEDFIHPVSACPYETRMDPVQFDDCPFAR